MSRRTQVWSSLARAAAKRIATRAREMLTTEPAQAPDGDAAEAAGASEIAATAASMKGAMAKAAQLMAYQVGPGAAQDPSARRALAALWDRVPGVEAAAVAQVIAEDLGASPEELFAAFEPAPLAAASLGQVHAARGPDRTDLAVKVQYPGIAAALEEDLRSGRLLGSLAGSDLGGSLSPEARATLREAVLAELDYVAEARWQERFRLAFAGDPDIHVPRTFAALSSRRVLTAERVTGQTLPEVAADGDLETRTAVAMTIFRFGFGAPLLHGLVNADPNPGNFIALGGARVAFLDFGCCAEIEPALVAADRRLFRAIWDGEPEMVRHAVHETGLVPRDAARVLDSGTYRSWEHFLAAPYLRDRPFRWNADYARGLAELTHQLVAAGGMSLPAGALLLWRQRLGLSALLGALAPEADFRRALGALVGGFDRTSRIYT